MKQLVIRADDLGYSYAVNLGIVRAVRDGLVRSVGLMPNMPEAVRGLAWLSERGLDVAVGQHTNVCLGTPCADSALIPSLVGPDGQFRSSREYRSAFKEGMDFVDLDQACAEKSGMPVPDYLHRFGEEAFRTLETEVAREQGARSGLVIACGGGIVTRERNYPLLHQNGAIVLLDRPLGELSSAGRPLSQSRGVDRLAAERMPAYRAWADLAISCTGSAEGDAQAILQKLGYE